MKSWRVSKKRRKLFKGHNCKNYAGYKDAVKKACTMFSRTGMVLCDTNKLYESILYPEDKEWFLYFLSTAKGAYDKYTLDVNDQYVVLIGIDNSIPERNYQRKLRRKYNGKVEKE